MYLCIADKTYLSNLMPCTNLGRPLSVVRISVLPEVSQMGYRYRVVPYRLWKFCATSERPRQSQTKLVWQKKMSVTHISCFAKFWKHIQKATWVDTGIYQLLWNHGPTGGAAYFFASCLFLSSLGGLSSLQFTKQLCWGVKAGCSCIACPLCIPMQYHEYILDY